VRILGILGKNNSFDGHTGIWIKWVEEKTDMQKKKDMQRGLGTKVPLYASSRSERLACRSTGLVAFGAMGRRGWSGELRWVCAGEIHPVAARSPPTATGRRPPVDPDDRLGP
jgi:hypothetical protein